MFYLTNLPDNPDGYVNISTSTEWEGWVRACLPAGLSEEIQGRLISNLKHVLVGLELKAALIVPHAERGADRSILFEPYVHIMNFEFSVGVFSICEGIGSAIWLRQNGLDGAEAERIGSHQWKPSLVNTFDPHGEFELDANVDHVKSVRDMLHQDRLGARQNIDWHAFSYENAFTPALHALQCLLCKGKQHVPQDTNLKPA